MSAIPAQVGIKVDLYFYADHCDLPLLYAHIVKTIQKVQSICGKANVGLQLHFPLFLETKCVQKFLEEELRIGQRVTTAPFTVDTAVAYLLCIITKSSL